jgi:uncharacterized membrane protein
MSRLNMSEVDRWGSMAAGAALALYGLRRWRRGGWLFAAGGLYLFRRGKTGHCVTYHLLGISRGDDGRSDMPVAKPVGIRAIETGMAIKTLCDDDRLVTTD